MLDRRREAQRSSHRERIMKERDVTLEGDRKIFKKLLRRRETNLAHIRQGGGAQKSRG